MEHYDMLRAPLLFALFVLAALAPAQDLQKILNDRYQELNRAITRSDSDAIKRWVERHVTTDFSYKSMDGHTFNRDQFLKGLQDQVKTTKRVISSSMRPERPSVRNNSATIEVKADFKGIVTLQTRDFTLTDESVTSDTWVRVGNDWKLKGSLQTKSKTQMYQL
jgi:hypothetical protein